MNSYFQFKQFRIHQDRCAQKVSEMGCLFGAWIKLNPLTNNVLDIGAGTGVLSLMLAQHYDQLQLDAVEVHEETYRQLVDNCTASPFHNRIRTILTDVRQLSLDKTYDAIVVNPPFHENQLKSKDVTKNKAWHSDNLLLSELVAIVDQVLSPTGEFFLLLPMYRLDELSKVLVSYSLYVSEILHIKHSVNHTAKIAALKLTRQESSLTQTELIVKNEGEYTPTVKEWLAPYYLKL